MDYKRLLSLLQVWDDCMQRADQICRSINDANHQLFHPWPRGRISQDPPSKEGNTDQETTQKAQAAMTKEEEKIVHEAEELLSHAQKMRNRLLTKNAHILESELKSSQQDIFLSENHLSDLADEGEIVVKEKHKVSDDDMTIYPPEEFALISSSTLEELMRKHSLTVDKSSKYQPKFTTNAVDRKVKGDKANFMSNNKTTNDHGQSKKKVVMVPKPVSASKVSRYKTSSSEIGKMIHNGNNQVKIRSASSVSAKKPPQVIHHVKHHVTKVRPVSSLKVKVNGSKTIKEIQQGRDVRCLRTLQNATLKQVSSIKKGEQEPRVAEEVPGNESSVKDDSDTKEVRGTTHDRMGNGEQMRNSFLLSRDGGSLKIPKDVTKLLASNTKLRLKLTEIEQRRKSVRGPSCQKRLEEKLNSQINGTFTKNMILQQAHDRIAMAIEECKQLLKQMSKPEENHSERFALGDLTESSRGLEERCNNLKERWKQIRTEIDLMGDFSSINSDLSSQGHLPHHLRTVEYSSLSELQTWIGLQIQVCQLQQQMEIEKAITNVFLPVLQQMDPTDPTFHSFYRSVNGLLCSGGQVFPTLICFQQTDEREEEDYDSEKVMRAEAVT